MRDVLGKAAEQFRSAQDHLGRNRLTELQFHHVHEALKKHKPWRESLAQWQGAISHNEYERRYNFTKLRDAVMRGRPLFNTYAEFRQQSNTVAHIEELVASLDRYNKTVKAEHSEVIRHSEVEPGSVT